MGLIKATIGSIGGTLMDQWRDAIRCEDMGNDILMMKKTTKNGVISNGSSIIVGPGQCAIIYDNGRILDATAEEGYYKFDTSSTPSLFEGEFKGMLQEMWQRFTYNGASAKQQAVFYFNTKEILNNKFGTPVPVMYDDWSHPMHSQITGGELPLAVNIRCFGNYTFKIQDFGLFMNEITGMSEIYRKETLTEQMRSEVIEAFEKVLNELGNVNRIPVRSLPSQKDKIKEIIDSGNFDEKFRRRGIRITGFVIESVTLDDESKQKINNYELGSNQYMQQGTMVGAYSQAMRDAAQNPNGAVNGFMGMGMANMASGGMMGGATVSPWQNAQNQPQSQNINSNANSHNSQSNNEWWKCDSCKEMVKGNFCPKCGTKKPENRFCSNCGKEIEPNAKFCSNCGNRIE